MHKPETGGYALASGRGQPKVTPNPNTDPHRALKKASRHIQASLDMIQKQLAGQGRISTSDDRVVMLEHLSFAMGLVEGYIEGSEWVKNDVRT